MLKICIESPALKQVSDCVCWGGPITHQALCYGVTSPMAAEHCAVKEKSFDARV